MDSNGIVYLTDNDKKGSIYRFVPDKAGDLSAGQLYALRSTKKGKNRNGSDEWVPLDKEQVQKDARSAAAKLHARLGCSPLLFR